MKAKKRFVFLCVFWSTLSMTMAGNLIRNGDFTAPGTIQNPQPPLTRPDTRIPSWEMLNAEWHVDRNEKAPWDGASVLRVDGEIFGPGKQLLQNVPLKPGKTYTLSAWVRAEGLSKSKRSSGDAQVGVVLTDWRWTKSIPLVSPQEFGAKWHRYSKTFVAPEAYGVAGVEQPCRLRIFFPRGEKGTLFVTGIQLEEGHIATDFQPISVVEKRQSAEMLRESADRLKQLLVHLKQFDGGTDGALTREIENQIVQTEALWERIKDTPEQSPEEWHQLAGEAAALTAVANRMGIVGWWENAWKDLPSRVLPQRQEEGNPDHRVRIVLGINDYGALLLPVANFTGNSLPVEVSVGGKTSPFSTLSDFEGPLTASRVLMVSHQGLKSPVPPAPEEKEYPYFLETLGNGNTAILPAGETTQFWFDIDSRNLAPGEHVFPVRLNALNQDYVWEGQIIVEVLPVTLPEKVPAHVVAFAAEPFFREPFRTESGNWPILQLSSKDRLEIARPWLEAWKDMGFNRLMLTTQSLEVRFSDDGTLAAEVDYSLMDAYRELWASIGADCWGGYNLAAYHIYPDWKNSQTLLINDLNRKRTKSFFESLLTFAEGKGLTAENFPISMFDEPHGEQIAVARQGAEVLKEINPNGKVLSTISGVAQADVKHLLPFVDIFVVRQRMGQMDMLPETITWLKDSGKTVWGYSCSGSFEYTNPYRYYRLLPWQAWNNGLEGYGVFMTLNEKAYSRLGAKSAFYSPLFLGREGPVFGKGARAFQLGGRDWCLFTLARQTAKELQDQGAAEDSSRLRKLLDESIQHVLAHENDSEAADVARGNLLREVARLQEMR